MNFSTEVNSSKQRLSQIADFIKDHIGNATCLCVVPFALSLGFCSLAVAQQVLATQPNVVLIMADDLGYSDVGSYGATDVQTPNIDSLAREGVRLTDFYSNGPTCSPTRAALISGRYQQRYGLEMQLINPHRERGDGLPVTGFSLPQLLSDHGYITGLTGKWHLGWEVDNSPNAHGFDYFFGFKNGWVDYYQHTSVRGEPDLFENDRRIELEGYMTDLITERSVQFIEQNAARPFFIDISYNAPHWPFQPPDREPSSVYSGGRGGPFDTHPGTRSDYVAMVERMDQGIGQVLATLDRLDLTDKTIVIFTNDNGGEWLSNGTPLFHYKNTAWEGGIRVPAIIRWPGRIPAGRVSSQVGITMDLTATILSSAGALVSEARLDGIDLLPILEGRAAEVERKLFWRVIDDRSQRAVRSGNMKLLLDGELVLLFDLETDISERETLISDRPDVARELRRLLEEWEQEVDTEAGVE